jgi:branched-chain amino acid transport system permease protein
MIVPVKRTRSGEAIFGLILTACLAVTPFLVSERFVSAMTLAAIYCVMTVGLNLFMGYAGQTSFGHNSFAAIGGYGSTLLVMKLGVPPVLAVVAAAIGAGVIAFIVGLPTLRLRGHYLAMATLALGLMAGEIVTQWKSLTQGLLGISAIPPLGLGSWELTSETGYYYLYWAMAGVAIWLVQRIRASRVGYAIRALAGDETAAQSLGVNTAHYKLLAFMVSAMLTSCGGSMFAHYITFVSPEVFGLYMVILLFTMLYVGGVNTTFGPLIGAIFITLLPELLRGMHGAREFIYAGLLLMILIFAPRGVYEVADLFDRSRRGSAAPPARDLKVS